MDIGKKGLLLRLNGKKLPIIYPEKIWRTYPKEKKEALKDNLAYTATFFVPIMLQKEQIDFETARPLMETFAFKNGIYDMSFSAHVDGRSSVAYVKQFMNVTPVFNEERVRIPKITHKKNKKEEHVIIPFTFGKESLLTYAITKEIGLVPHLVYVLEPAHQKEARQKKNLITRFKKETGVEVEVIEYGPGLLRYGALWNLKTELGWGLQTTDYTLLSLPIAEYYGATWIFLGNEYSCRDASKDEEGVLTHWAGYDQHPDWAAQQSIIATLISGRKITVTSIVEPLHEIAEMKILHKRYPNLAKFQSSCSGYENHGKNRRWCEQCEKCACVFTFLAALGINPKTTGFRQNLFDEKHTRLFQNLFDKKNKDLFYGNAEEMGLALSLAKKRGWKGRVIEKHSKQIGKMKNKKSDDLASVYLHPQPSKYFPKQFSKKIEKIFKEELG